MEYFGQTPRQDLARLRGRTASQKVHRKNSLRRGAGEERDTVEGLPAGTVVGLF